MTQLCKELQRKLSASPYSKQPNKTGEFEGLQVFVKDFGGRTGGLFTIHFFGTFRQVRFGDWRSYGHVYWDIHNFHFASLVLHGRTRVMRINPLADVSEIHSQIAQKINIREDVFYLTCMGHILHPGFSALYYGLSRDCTLLMNGRLPSVAVVDYPDLARVHWCKEADIFNDWTVKKVPIVPLMKAYQ